MQCDYCGLEILGPPLHIEVSAEDVDARVDMPMGDLYFCSPECHVAYMEEAGIPLGDGSEEESEEEEYSFSDRMRYTL